MKKLSSITDLNPSFCGEVVVVGSHGGRATGVTSAAFGVAGLICHDAGIGLERAGVACLDWLVGRRIAAAATCHDSARIGDADDMMARGVISCANDLAAELGVIPGMPTSEAVGRLTASVDPQPASEALTTFNRDDHKFASLSVVLCDSVSQITPADAGHIVVTGSHGGLPGRNPVRAAKADITMGIFNDAGVGVDQAGLSRLPALDTRGIPAACVDCMTARIGDARSTYEQGVFSHVNRSAFALGLQAGMSVRDAVRLFNSIQTGLNA